MGASLPPIQLGTDEVVESIAIGHDFFCALLEGGGVKCWGRNTNGQCGREDVETYGDDPNEMGDNLPFVDLGTGKTAVAVSAGDAHACALLDDDSVKVRVRVWSRPTRGVVSFVARSRRVATQKYMLTAR